jgi:hypothetical protein
LYEQENEKMKEARLDNELERIHEKFSFLWKDYHLHVKYLTRDYGMYYRGYIIGLENDVCKLVFEKETESPVESIAINVGKKISPFAPPNYSYFAKDGWYPLVGIIYWLSGVECERHKNADEDLVNVSQYLGLHIEKVLDLFKSPDEFDRKLEHYRNLYKENQITVEKIREERARLHALGLDSSLEAAIANLRGGKK